MHKRLWWAFGILAAIAAFGPVASQTAPYVALWFGAGPVSSANPLPVSASFSAGAIPTPIPWTTASPEPVSCVTVAAVGACGPTPIPFPTLGIVQQAAPLATTPVTTPAPCSTAACSVVAWPTGLQSVTTPAPYTTASPGAAGILAAGLCTGGAGCAPAVGDTGFRAAATTVLTQFIAAPGPGVSIRVTAIQAGGYDTATGGQIQISSGTGTNCTTTNTVEANLIVMPAALTQGGGDSMSWGNGVGAVMIIGANRALCVQAFGTVGSAQISGTYTTY